MALWGKKEGEQDAQATEAGGGRADELEQLAATLERFDEMVRMAGQQLVACRVKLEAQAQPPTDEATGESTADADEAVAKLSAKLDDLAGKIDQFAARKSDDPEAAGPGDASSASAPAESTEPPAPAEPHPELMQALGLLGQQLQDGRQAVDGALGHIWQRLDNGLRELNEQLAPPESEEEPASAHGDWEAALLGPDLAARADLAADRRQLAQDVLSGGDGARALAGQLLIFQSTPAERLAQILRDVGDAYYRWRPKTQPGAQPLEAALAEWVTATCDRAGIGNRIELVDPGERFDAARHNATGRGVEITQVLGWIVLRDNGRVYTKANVAVR